MHVLTGTGAPVETLAAYNGVVQNKLFAASGGAIVDVTISPASSGVTGTTNSRFQFINFAGTGGHYLYLVNGAEIPYHYNGSTWARPTITGTGINPEKFININAHKKRIWFVIKDSLDACYLPVDSIQGEAKKFPLGSQFTRGGYLVAMGTWSIDGGNGPDDYAVFVSSVGQVAVYSGVDPDTDFSLVGVFDIGAPVGYRCLTKVSSDIAVICIDGVLPLSRALIFERAAVQQISLTARIQSVMNQSARDYSGNFGWQLISYPRGTRAILNVPVVEGQQQEQYVMNTLTGAWCRFNGMNANCWELFNDKLYFGGNAGGVFLADIGASDNGRNIHAEAATAFNYFDARGRQKRWTMCRPLLTTDQSIVPGIALNVDFQDNAPISSTASRIVNQSRWDEALWDVAQWPENVFNQLNWLFVSGVGYCASAKIVVDTINPRIVRGGLWGSALWGNGVWGSILRADITLRVNGFDLTMEDGGIV